MSNEIQVQEDFDHPRGELNGYDSYSTAQRFALGRQRHVDIRSFENQDIYIRLQMVHLSTMTMNYLSQFTMNDLSGEVIGIKAEEWTEGDLEIATDHANWRGLVVSCPANEIVSTTSVLTNG